MNLNIGWVAPVVEWFFKYVHHDSSFLLWYFISIYFLLLGKVWIFILKWFKIKNLVFINIFFRFTPSFIFINLYVQWTLYRLFFVFIQPWFFCKNFYYLSRYTQQLEFLLNSTGSTSNSTSLNLDTTSTGFTSWHATST